MASSIKTKPNTILGPISGSTLFVLSCTNMQKTDISEICSEALYCETLSLGSTIGSGWNSNHAELFARRFQPRDQIYRNCFYKVSEKLSTSVIGSSHPVSLPTAVSASVTLDLGKDEAADLPRPSWLKYDYDRAAEKKKNSKPLSYRWDRRLASPAKPNFVPLA